MNTSIIVGFVAIAVIAVIKAIVHESSRSQDNCSNKDKMKESEIAIENNAVLNPYRNDKTTSLVLAALQKLGGSICKIDKENGRINYDFQGHRFLVDCSDESLYIDVWDPCWYDIPLNDIDKLCLMRKVVNKANQSEFCSLFYNIDTERNIAIMSSKKNTVFVSSICDLDKYLLSLFDALFKVERRFITEFERYEKLESITL